MNTPANATPIVLTVSQITRAIKLQLESTFRFVMIKGEISNLKVQSSGHVYFTLKDNLAQISCVLFQLDAKKLKAPLKMGDKVTVRGELSVYEARGNYQIIVREVILEGLGEQLLRLEELKQKLKAKGYFDTTRKRQLPHLPSRIGVVTSETGAVIRDIIHVLNRRLQKYHLILNPVRVQGDGAAEEIAQAIYQFNTYQLADVLIIGRGGGSFEELSCFNDERVAKAIFESTIPVVSAVGHETDVTISDLVADVRAPTPSAAAEIISKEKQKLLEAIDKMHKNLEQRIRQCIEHKRSLVLRASKHPLFQTQDYLTHASQQKLDDIREQIDQAAIRFMKTKREILIRTQRSCELVRPSAKLAHNKQRLLDFDQAFTTSLQNKLRHIQLNLKTKIALLDRLMAYKIQNIKKTITARNFSYEMPKQLVRKIAAYRESLQRIEGHLQSVNPKNVLKRGYSILFSEKEGAVITSVATLTEGDRVSIQLLDGKVTSEVLSVTEQEA